MLEAARGEVALLQHQPHDGGERNEVAALPDGWMGLEEREGVPLQGRATRRPRRSRRCCLGPYFGCARIRRRSPILRAPLDAPRVGTRGRPGGSAIPTSAWRSAGCDGSRRRSNPPRRRSRPPSRHRARASVSQFPADCPHRTDCHCSLSRHPRGV